MEFEFFLARQNWGQQWVDPQLIHQTEQQYKSLCVTLLTYSFQCKMADSLLRVWKPYWNWTLVTSNTSRWLTHYAPGSFEVDKKVNDQSKLENLDILLAGFSFSNCLSRILKSNKINQNSWQQNFRHILKLDVDWSWNTFSPHIFTW